MVAAWCRLLGSRSSGRKRVLAFLARVAGLSDLVAATTCLNGMPGARFSIAGDDTAVSLVIENDLITRIYAVRNPNKLGGLGEVAELRR